MKSVKTYITLAILCLLLPACSTKKNTAGTRFWQSFTTRYNVFFNGNQAYKQGCETKENGNRDNYTEIIPVFLVGNEKSATLGNTSFDIAITKCEKAIHLHSIKKRPQIEAGKKMTPKMKAYLSRKEFNPFLKNAWLLMGKAQFQKGDFSAASATFSYITRLYAAEPLVANEARIWQARCYTAQEWYYDAEESLAAAERDTLDKKLSNLRDATRADLLLAQKKYAEALPFLENTAASEKNKLKKARLYFLLGQVQREVGNAEAAYKALSKCIKQSPPYEMAFNAQILQTEVLSEDNKVSGMIKRLQKMAKSSKNKEYLDQVYFAMGNIYMSQKDTAAAISAYETGRKKSTRNGIEKGILSLRLAEVYWDKGRYDKAGECYSEVISLLDKEYDGYEQITRRSKVLDELVPHTNAIYLQDSLLHLSTLSEEELGKAIDRVIEELKRKEEEERKARADSAAAARQNEMAGSTTTRPGINQQTNNNTMLGQSKEWYFYNPMLVAQGKQDFRKTWGNRKNEDDWRRSNKTVLANLESDEIDYAAEDSLAALQDSLDALPSHSETASAADSIANDPHNREYYLKQIPFSEEAKTESHRIIKDALYNAGLIEKDKLEDFPLAAKTLTRLCTDYPDCPEREDAIYQLFLLYSRWGNHEQAAHYKSLLARDYPNGAMTRVITDPNYEYTARFAREIEDSLYTATYAAYRTHKSDQVEANFTRSTQQFPLGLNRPKFIFVHALSRIGRDTNEDIAEELRTLVKDFPQSDVSEMAGMIVKGLESGRTIGEGVYDIGALWSRRSSEARKAGESASTIKQFSAERVTPFYCIIAYPTGTLDDNKLLYDLAHFNFTGFMVRGFDLSIERDKEITQFRIAGFNSYDEAHTYAQKMYASTTLNTKLTETRLVIISKENLELLGTYYSFDEYKAFYDRTFAPLDINPNLMLDGEGDDIPQRYEDEYTPEELEQLNNTESETDDEGEWY